MGSVSNINVHESDYGVKDSLAREHIADKNNPHEISAEQLGLSAFKDKTPKDIINTLTKDKIVSVLEYTPANSHVESDVDNLQNRVKVLEDEAEKDPYSKLDLDIGLEVTEDGTLNIVKHGTIHIDKGDSVSRAEINRLNDQVRELFQFVSDTREKLAAAITDRGVYTRPDATFDEIINNIYQIQGNQQLLRPIFGTFMMNRLGEGKRVNTPVIQEALPKQVFTPTEFEEYIRGGE